MKSTVYTRFIKEFSIYKGKNVTKRENCLAIIQGTWLSV